MGPCIFCHIVARKSPAFIIQSVVSNHPAESLTSIQEKILKNGV